MDPGGKHRRSFGISGISVVRIRGSKNTHGPVLTIPAVAWRQFAKQLSGDIANA